MAGHSPQVMALLREIKNLKEIVRILTSKK